tara:strand:+ start:5 stop:457 length:453 start_codon:yes stop_codon:yes gene_type:complete
MPDGASHILIQTVINKFINDKKLIPYLLFGAVAPDLFKAISRVVSPQYEWIFFPTHSPIYMFLVFYFLSQFFHKIERINLIKGCMIGMLIHLSLDLMQINYDGGDYMPFFPISFETVSLGLIKTEASVYWLPVTIFVALFINRNHKISRL